MDTRTQNLDTTLTALLDYAPLQSSSWETNKGSSTYLGKTWADIHYQSGQSESKNMGLAILRSKSNLFYGKSNYSLKFLRKTFYGNHNVKQDTTLREQPSEPMAPLDLTFIHTPLYIGKKSRIFELAEGDVIDYYEKNPTAKIDIKEWFAQMLLAIYEFHRHKLVHRDIKPDNFLVFLYAGSIHLKLTDLDEIRTTNTDIKNTPIMTPHCLAPEAGNSHWQCDSRKNEMDKNKYDKADKYALDCYALGITFRTICFNLASDEYKTYSNLFNGLLNSDWKKRLTITQALQDPCFGETPIQRMNYFAGVKKKFAKPDTYFDGYYRHPNDFFPEENNAFLLLPKSLKHIYLTAADLNDQINCIKAHNNNKPIYGFQFFKNYYVNDLTLEAIQNKAQQLLKLIADYPKDSEPKDIISALRIAATEALELVRDRY